jgi:hypothetical protein
MEKQLSERKVKLLREGVKLSIKEITTIKNWIKIEISLMLVELITWILLILLHNNAFFYLTIFLPLITIIYIGFLVPFYNEWWKNTKFSFPVKKITSDFRYIYIFTRNDKEFCAIIYLMNILPSIVLMTVVLLSVMNTFSVIKLKVDCVSTIVFIPFQILIIFWIIMRLVFLRRLYEFKSFLQNDGG